MMTKHLKILCVLLLFVTGCAAGEPYMRLKGVEIYKTEDDEVTGYVYQYEAVYPDSTTKTIVDIAKEAL